MQNIISLRQEKVELVCDFLPLCVLFFSVFVVCVLFVCVHIVFLCVDCLYVCASPPYYPLVNIGRRESVPKMKLAPKMKLFAEFF